MRLPSGEICALFSLNGVWMNGFTCRVSIDIIAMSSPIDVGKVGLRLFADAGTVYDKGQRYKDQTLKQGYGAGVFLSMPVFILNLDVAHGKGAGTKVYFGGGFSF